MHLATIQWQFANENHVWKMSLGALSLVWSLASSGRELSVLISSSGTPSDHHKINISTAIQRIIYAGRTREREIKKFAARKCVARKIWIFTDADEKNIIAPRHTPRGEFYGWSAREPRARFRSLILFGPRLLLKFGRVIIFARAPLLFAPSTTPWARPTLFAAPH